MIVVDTSAIFAIVLAEPEARACRDRLAESDFVLISAGTLSEARVGAARKGWSPLLEALLSTIEMEVVPVDAATSLAVGDAYARWGRGLHPAGLNFGDCFSYVLAKERGCPLLFIGNDFAKTDLTSALP